jgi:hypothetical protein
VLIRRRCLITWLGLAGLTSPFVVGPRPASAVARGAVRIHGPGVARELVLDDAALAALGAEDLATRTPWTEGVPRFGGVPLVKALKAVGVAGGSSVRAIALNDYAVEFSADDAIAKSAFLARTMDGRKLTVRDKGPFWMIFPWSERPELDTASVQALSVWQLRELEIH